MYDLVALGDKNIRNLTYAERLFNLEKYIVGPREQSKKVNFKAFENEPFGIRVKKFFFINEFNKLRKDLIPMLPHATDGYIFAPNQQPYTPGTNQRLLKWKPWDQNSMDFLLKIERVQHVGKLPETIHHLMVVGDKGILIEFSRNFYPNGAKVSDLNGKIIECNPRRDQFGGLGWEFHRVREDKTTPNANSTANSVVKSIELGIPEPDLIAWVARVVQKKILFKQKQLQLQAQQNESSSS